MKNLKTILNIILIVSLALAVFAGCSKTEVNSSISTTASTSAGTETGFNYSEDIADNGFWKDITALDYVDLCKYTGISIPSNIYEISDESVQTEIDNILAENTSSNQITDRAVVDGDTVNIDYVGSIDGVEFEGGNTKGQGAEVTIGVTSYIDDFLEQLIGHTPGESFDIEVTFPENYGDEKLNGKDAVFAITINHIIETITPELTDDFVAQNLSASYGWNTVEEMKSGIRSDLQSTSIVNYMQDYIIENTTVTSVPENLLKYQENSMVQYFQESADYYSMDLNEFLKAQAGVATTDELLAKYIDDNTKAASFHLVIQAIAEDAKILVNDDDVAAYFKDYMGTEDYSQYEEKLGIPYLKLIVLEQAVLNYLEDNAVKG
jgi:trigger factor